MPARATRRGGVGEQNVELLNAIILKLTQNNPGRYDELLSGWAVKREDALAEQQRTTDLHKEHVAELESREAVLAWRTDRLKRFLGLVMGGYTSIIRDDDSLDDVESGIDALLAEQPPVAATVQ